jgi:hypothetical protein
MPLQATSGAASYDAFGGGVPVAVNYIEDVFSTYLYTGNATSRSINNGIDLLGKGGLLWAKSRDSSNSLSNYLVDTARGDSFYLYSEATNAQANLGAGNSFSNTGFNLSSNVNLNANTEKYASWTFRKQPKFFDVVTYSGSSSTQNIAHNLGSVPACIIVKRTSGAEDWFVYHTSLGNTQYLKLNTTGAAASGFAAWNNTSPTSTQFTVLGGRTEVNAAGSTYVAYLFAHNAGGFGLTGTDNVISCGSYTTDGSNKATVNLGYEPQWLLIKRTDSAGAWYLMDTTRSWSMTAGSSLNPNSSSAEADGFPASYIIPTATGFQDLGAYGANVPFIYIASVFNAITRTGTGSAATISGIGFAPDLVYPMCRNDVANKGGWVDKLRGASRNLTTNLLDAESANTQGVTAFGNTSIAVGTSSFFNSALNYVNYFFQRAPSFFDEVCYSGNSVAGRTLTHNLGVVPQLIILKARTIDVDWSVYAEPAGNTKQAPLNDVTRFTTGINCWNNTSPTSSVFSLSSNAQVNRTGDTYVAYLFSTCAGVSKVGSYTGIGSLQTINCGFTSGARFVLIKNQDVNGSWYVWDSARGISSSNDPYLLLNSTAAEVTNTNYVDTDSTGFKVTGNTAVNTFGDTYIFLAIA